MLRVLIITYYWPPAGGSGVQRWVKFAKYFPALGIQPVIYTPENPEMTAVDNSLEKDIPAETEILKTRITEFYGAYRFLMGKKREVEVTPINARKKTFKQRLALALRSNLFIPDPRVTWVRPSVKFLRKYIREHPVDVIVTTGPPQSMHLIGKKLAAATGIPWVADFRDPWTKMFYFKHLSLVRRAERKHRKLEKEVLDKADAVVAVSPFVQREFQEMTSTPVELVTNGYDESDFYVRVVRDNFFNIVHTGLFAADGNPEVLWKVLSEKCRNNTEFASRLSIRLTGKTERTIIDSIVSSGLSRQLVDLGYRNHTEAVREQKGGTLLILPLRKEPEYRAALPGKLFEYLASGNPILGIGQSDGAMAEIISDTCTGAVFDWEEEEKIRKFIDKEWLRFKKGQRGVKGKNIEQYSRRVTAGKMAALLRSVAEKGRK